MRWLATYLVVCIMASSAVAQQIYVEKTYDAYGNLTLMRGPVYGPNPDPGELASLAHTYSYNYSGGYSLLVAATHPMNQTETYTWSIPQYVLSTHSKQNGAVTRSFTYDGQGRPVSITDTDGTEVVQWQFTYPSAGVRVVTDPRGMLTEEVSDAFGRLIQVTGPAASQAQITALKSAGQFRTIQYDAAGNRTQVTDELGQSWTWSHDAMGNVLSETAPNGESTDFTYNPDGTLATVHYANAPSGYVSESYYYDQNARVEAVAILVETTKVNYIGYVRDVNGRITFVVGPASSLVEIQQMIASESPVISQCEYDALGRVTQVGAGNRATAYTYDARNNETSVSNAGTGTRTSVFDWADRLVYTVGETGLTTTYQYDILGRNTGRTGPWLDGNQNQIPDDADAALTRTRQLNLLGLVTQSQTGSMTPVTSQYDYLLKTSETRGTATRTWCHGPAGEVLTRTDPWGTTTTYSYDGALRTTGVRVGDGTALEVRADIERDACGREVLRTLYPVSQSTTTTLTRSRQWGPGGTATSLTNFDGRVHTTTYDLAFQVTSAGIQGGHSSTFGWTDRGALASRVHRDQPACSYDYASEGDMSQYSRPGGQAWTVARDT